MKSQPKPEVDPPRLMSEQQGEDWNRWGGVYDDDEECRTAGKLPPIFTLSAHHLSSITHATHHS